MEHRYTKNQINQRFKKAINKNLGEIDTVGDFNRAINNPKITGIAGDVVEHSILGYPSDTKQKPDIIIDDKEFEVKTTGVRGEYLKPKTYTAKERLTITNVSPNKIKNEIFDTSSLWNKLENTLLAYYLYDSPNVVPAKKYAEFPFLGYQLHKFSDSDRKVIEQDWQIIRDFCNQLTEIFKDSSPEAEKQAKEYSEAKKDLMYLETAPGWKNGPRFALKKSYINTIIQEHFENQSLIVNEPINSYAELDKFLADKSNQYKGKNILTIQNELGSNKKDLKSIASSLITQILNPNADVNKGEDQFDLIKKSGILVKAFTTKENGNKKENAKFINVNFDEFNDASLDVHNSSIYEYFCDNKFLFAIFKDDGKKGQEDDVFQGFKRLSFTDEYLEKDLVPVLKEIKNIIVNKKLEIKPKITKSGNYIYNKTGEVQVTNNLPKSREGNFFINGTGSNSKNKPLKIQGQKLYYQQIWLRGDKLIELLSKINYL